MVEVQKGLFESVSAENAPEPLGEMPKEKSVSSNQKRDRSGENSENGISPKRSRETETPPIHRNVMRQGTWEGQGEDFGLPIPPPYSSEPQTPTYTLTPRPYMEFVPPAAIHHFSEQALNDQVTDTPDFGEPPPGTDAWEEWAQRTDAKLEWLRELVENPQNTDAGTQLAEDTIMEHVIK